MTIQEIFRTITERIQDTASVRTVYGDPITAEGKTIIPVARVRYGFGGGGCSKGEDSMVEEAQRARRLGGGGGGGASVSPVGIIEITAGETRFISFEEPWNIIRAALIGLVVGMVLFRRRR